MEMLKDYYKNVCKRRQEELTVMYAGNYEISYRWQDIVEEAKKNNNKNAR